MPKARQIVPAPLKSRFLLTVHAWSGPGGVKAVRAFDTQADRLDHMADVVTTGEARE